MRTSSGKHALVWGGLLILFGVLSFLEIFININRWAWVIVLMLAGLSIMALFLTNRREGWLLIPSYVLLAIAGLIFLTETYILVGNFVAFYVLAAVGFPFLVVFLRDHEQWWALIPAYVLFAVGLMVVLIGMRVLTDMLVPAYIMFAIAIPFFVVFARNSENRWALIPGGIMAIIGFSFMIAESAVQYVTPVVLIIVGVWIVVWQFRKNPDDLLQENELDEIEQDIEE
jgi:hypothetical protein